MSNLHILEVTLSQYLCLMTTTEIALKMLFDRWNASIKNFDEVLQTLSDATLELEIAPGKNRGIYLLGHMIAVHDEMLILLDLGEKLYPWLYIPFEVSPDRAVSEIPTAAELRKCWTEQCAVLKQKFSDMPAEGWFEKHTKISAEDFVKEPHRNKLNIILTRTTHLAHHTGQLLLLKR